MTDIPHPTSAQGTGFAAASPENVVMKDAPEDWLERLLSLCDEINEFGQPDDLTTYASLAKAIMKFRLCKGTCGGALASVLNNISRIVHKELAKGKDDLIIFMDTHARPMKYHPNDHSNGQPALIAVLESVYKALDVTKSPPSWHHVVSLVEEKSEVDIDADLAQCGTYLGLASQARPDMVLMLGVAASTESYCIRYSSPAGLQTSVEFSWDNLEPLFSYMYTLYSPRTDQPCYDETIRLSPHLSVTDAPTWDVEVGEETYHNCQVKIVGNPWGRMTWTAVTQGPDTFVIKDIYRDQDATISERDPREILHNSGPTSGFPRIVSQSDVMVCWEVGVKANPGKIAITATAGECTKTKTRLVMRASDDPLTKSPSILNFMKVMYDTLEAHRWAVSEKVKATDPSARGPKRPVFIDGVLSKEGNTAAPYARIMDLDHAASYKSADFLGRLARD